MIVFPPSAKASPSLLRLAIGCLGAVVLAGRGAAAEAEHTPAACAVRVARTIADPNRIYLLRRIAERLGAKREREAAQVLAHALQLANRVDKPFSKASALECIAGGHAAIGQRDKALRILSEALRVARGGAGGTRVVARAYADLGEPDEALQIVKTTGHGSLAYIARKFLEAGQRDRALALLAQARDTARAAAGRDCDDAMALGQVAALYAQAGELEQAFQLARGIKETVHRIESEARLSAVRFKLVALVQIANACTEAGREDKAREVLSYAHGVAREIPYRYLRSELTKDIALAYAGVGRYDRANMFPHYDRRGSPNAAKALEIARSVEVSLLRVHAVHCIAVKSLKAGDRTQGWRILREALKVATAIEDDDAVSELGFYERSKRRTRAGLARTCADFGRYDRAFQVAETIPKDRYHSYQMTKVLNDIAAKCIEAGEKGRALAALSRVVRIAGKEQSASALKDAALNYGKAGEAAKALKLLAQATQIARGYERAYNRSESLKDVALAYAQLERYDDALEIAKAIERAHHKAEVLAAVGAKYPKQGQRISDRARSILREIAASLE